MQLARECNQSLPPSIVSPQVNTKSLDGETDNKLRVAPKAFEEAGVRTAAQCGALLGEVVCEGPNDVTSDFSGVLRTPVDSLDSRTSVIRFISTPRNFRSYEE